MIQRFFVVGHFETERAPQAGVEQVRRANVGQSREHARAHAGVASIEIGEQRVDLAALLVGLGATQAAGQDREGQVRGELRDVVFRTVNEGTDHNVLAIVGDELGGHGLELPGEYQVEHEGDDDIVAVVAESDLVAAKLGSDAVEHGASKARAHGAVRFTFGDDGAHSGVGVIEHDAQSVIVRAHVLGERSGVVARLALIDVNGEEREPNGRTRGEGREQVVENVAVFAARHGDEDAVAFLDHVEAERSASDGTREFAFESIDVGHAVCLRAEERGSKHDGARAGGVAWRACAG